jgi:hypothetical protein
MVGALLNVLEIYPVGSIDHIVAGIVSHIVYIQVYDLVCGAEGAACAGAEMQSIGINGCARRTIVVAVSTNVTAAYGLAEGHYADDITACFYFQIYKR